VIAMLQFVTNIRNFVDTLSYTY